MNVRILKTHEEWCDWDSEMCTESEYYDDLYESEYPKSFPLAVVYEFDGSRLKIDYKYIYKEDLE